MKKGPYVPDVGHVIWLSLDPQQGREQAGRRPFLVLSPQAYNVKTSLAVGVPVTSARKGYPFEVLLPTGGRVTGAALADQVKSLDWRARKAQFKEKAPPMVLAEVQGKVRALIGP